MPAFNEDTRMEFDISGSISAEAVFLSLYIDRMQIDCMALAKKMDAVYLCDDLFFRNIADIAGIKNANLTNLVYILDSKKRAAEICMDFSKTNYIYVPFICENMEGIKHMWRNLLEGDIKGKFCGPIIRNLVNDEPKKIWNIEE